MQTDSLFYIYAPFSSSLHHFLHAPLCFSHDFSSSSVIALSKIMKRPFYRHDCQARPLLRTCYCPNLEPFPTLSHQRPVKDRKSFKGTGWVKNCVRWLLFFRARITTLAVFILFYSSVSGKVPCTVDFYWFAQISWAFLFLFFAFYIQTTTDRLSCQIPTIVW